MKPNKMTAVLLATVLAVGAVPVLSAQATTYTLGDVDMDGTITGHDAAMVTRALYLDQTLLTDEQLLLADVNEDGRVDQTDADWIYENQVYALGSFLAEDGDAGCTANTSYAIIQCLNGQPEWNFTQMEWNLLDVNGDGVVDMDDAGESLMAYAEALVKNDIFQGNAYFVNWNKTCGRTIDGCFTFVDKAQGDIDKDGAITAHDTVMLQRYLAQDGGTELDTSQLRLADVNEDGAVDQNDVELLQTMETEKIGTYEGEYSAQGAYEVLNYVAQSSVGETTSLSSGGVSGNAQILNLLDVDGDCVLTADDAFQILQLYATSAVNG